MKNQARGTTTAQGDGLLQTFLSSLGLFIQVGD